MLGIIAEADSDARVLKTLAKKVSGNPTLSIKVHGCDSCGEVYRKGALHLKNLLRLGCSWFIVSCDADNLDPVGVKRRLEFDVIRPSGLVAPNCIVVPVFEIESWILANASAIRSVVSSFLIEDVIAPEKICHPKEFLTRLSRNERRRPCYDPVLHNERIANFLDVTLIEERCASFRPFAGFVRSNGRSH